MKKLTRIALAATLALSGLAASAQTLLNASYDVAREFYKDYNAAFVANYKKTTGKDIKIDQAHGGSSAQARAVNDGLDADVVTMNTTTDVDFLASTGVVAKDWNKRFAHNAAPTSSTMLFLTRNGNPKGIKDWDDLVKPGIKVIVVNPKTGGNGRMAYLDYLYSDEAQEIAAKHALRPRNPAILKKYASTFKPIQLFTVNEVFGSFADAQKVHFNDGGQFDKIYTVK